MNELNIIHRNLKLSNILISLNKISFKLCDFRISKNIKDELTLIRK